MPKHVQREEGEDTEITILNNPNRILISTFILFQILEGDLPSGTFQRGPSSGTFQRGPSTGTFLQLNSSTIPNWAWAELTSLWAEIIPGSSTKRYLGILYNIGDDDWRVLFGPDIFENKKSAWVANRDAPISDASGALMIDDFGDLVISYSGGNVIPLSSIQTKSNTSVTLLDSGNLVLRELNLDGSAKRVLWESFDHPTDTLLPGMKLGVNFKTGQTWSLTSWRSEDNPSPGSFTVGGDPNGTSQLIIWFNGDVYWTSGSWQNERFEFVPELSLSKDKVNFSYIISENEKYFTFSRTNNQIVASYMISLQGRFRGISGVGSFGHCGYYHLSPGCVEQKLPECRQNHGWFVLKRVAPFDFGVQLDESYNMTLFECMDKCFNNCSCIAYAYTYENQTGCEMWRQGAAFGEDFNFDREIYLLHVQKESKWWVWLIIAAGGASLILFSCCVCCKRLRKLKAKGKSKKEQNVLLSELGAYTTEVSESERVRKPRKYVKKSHELQFFSFESISHASNSFSSINKLGQGGYGPVYKGLLDGQEIAIKRLSRSSGQGLQEFKNELALIARLQHNNLVKLIGCCIERDEKMLIYEYMPNKSLDFFLFDSTKKHFLDWKKRLCIIEGIAQGLLYLHKYSRLRIIHRDLKAGNILLDDDMNPKISDFGLARIFGQNVSEANTNRVVGTYGYMSPEYAMEGIFSIKSDVFSYGVLLLEIISGRKNTSFNRCENVLNNLIGYAWELWTEGRYMDMVDPILDGDSYNRNEVVKYIQVGLLCVQDSPVDRPAMPDVISMIANENMALPTPKQPAFVKVVNSISNVVESKSGNLSLNMVSVSDMDAR